MPKKWKYFILHIRSGNVSEAITEETWTELEFLRALNHWNRLANLSAKGVWAYWSEEIS